MQDPIKILIVEDEMSIALELEMIIDELGYQLIGVVDNLSLIHISEPTRPY